MEMNPPNPSSAPVLRRRGLVAGVAAPLLAACASAPAGVPTVATEVEWRALALPRPPSLPGAARVAIDAVQVVGALPWDRAAPVPPELGVAELAIAGLLGRRDVHLVERRRFAAAARAERLGLPRAPGAPAAGMSAGADYLVTAVWVRLAEEGGSVDVRLSEAASGAVAGAARLPVDEDDPVSIARTVVAGTLTVLDRLGRRPAWEDPQRPSGGRSTRSEVSTAALEGFLRGLAAEEEWKWEAARRAYQGAANASDFPEADAALARTARLRNGGTLGES